MTHGSIPRTDDEKSDHPRTSRSKQMKPTRDNVAPFLEHLMISQLKKCVTQTSFRYSLASMRRLGSWSECSESTTSTYI